MSSSRPLARVGGEALVAVGLEDRGVRHRHERRLGQQLARPREHVEALARPHAARERALGRAPDHRALRERVREREAELDDVGAALDRGRRELRRLRLRNEVDDERLAHATRRTPMMCSPELREHGS